MMIEIKNVRHAMQPLYLKQQYLKQQCVKGFTLIEMLLVLAIIAMLIYLGMGYYQQHLISSRIDKASLQMQQILNAGLAYYLANGEWPSDLSALQNPSAPYLPSKIVSPVVSGQYYVFTNPKSPSLLSVSLQIPAANNSNAVAQSISGKLPLSYTTKSDPTTGTPSQVNNCDAGKNCYVVGQVNIPGQNLNNAMAVNFVGEYRNGGCVPVPNCPALSPNGQAMTPQVFVVPASVSGFDKNSTSKILPIESFTAYATGPTKTAGTNPPACQNGAADPCKAQGDNATNLNYWRVCLQIYTTDPSGPISTKTGDWGDNVWLAAFSRCAIANEPSGSPSSVFTN